jgi:hypothetical protein
MKRSALDRLQKLTPHETALRAKQLELEAAELFRVASDRKPNESQAAQYLRICASIHEAFDRVLPASVGAPSKADQDHDLFHELDACGDDGRKRAAKYQELEVKTGQTRKTLKDRQRRGRGVCEKFETCERRVSGSPANQTSDGTTAEA